MNTIKKPYFIISLLVALMLTITACATDIAPTSTPVAQAVPTGKLITPHPSTLDLNNLLDAQCNVRFTSGDIYDNEGSLTIDLTVCERLVFDAVDISLLEIGDTLVFPDKKVVVTSLEKNEVVTINGGYANQGLTLASIGGGAYAEITNNNIPVLFTLGVVAYPVDQDFTLTDYTSTGSVQTYFAGDLFDVMQTNRIFPEYNTTARIVDGKIIEIVCGLPAQEKQIEK